MLKTEDIHAICEDTVRIEYQSMVKIKMNEFVYWNAPKHLQNS